MDLTGAIDLHVHTAPDVYERRLDDRAMVKEAAEAGMRAVLLKSHHTLTADRAVLARSAGAIEVFGGLVLNHTVGGINPVAVETAIEFGAREIWMPTIHADYCMKTAKAEMFQREPRRGRRGITVLDESGRPRLEVLAVLEMVRDAEIILGTGHISPVESLALLDAARDMGLERVLVTHPMMAFCRWSLEQLDEAVARGAMIEFDRLACCDTWREAVHPSETAAAMRRVGIEHCVMATDGGQPYNPTPPQMLRDFADAMLAEGLTEEQVRTMMCENPARLLGLP